ncbi:MAG: hypothetical protein AAF589_06405, partial [Planctomycetota bacterium]
GICLIRLKGIRPSILPFPWGLSSENAAHRIAVEWRENGEDRTGVYIPRRDTDSRLNSLLGGRVFPGVHHRASFSVSESNGRYSVAMASDDAKTSVLVEGHATSSFPPGSVFGSLEAASEFFSLGSVGYSDSHATGRFDGLELHCSTWNVEPLEVEAVRSSYFEDLQSFPVGSAEFDCALLMRDIDHEWHGLPDVCQGPKGEC